MLYRDPQLLDSALHAFKKVQRLEDFSIAREMHAVYLTASEFPFAALDYPIVFVSTGPEGGERVVSPYAMLGLVPNENLMLDGTRWDALYLPAFIRRYPFLTAMVQGATAPAPAVFVDASWSGFSDTQGEPLFASVGKPAEALTRAIEFLRRFDEEKLLALPDALVLELHRNGILMMMQAQLLSMTNMRRLVERKALRMKPCSAMTGVAVPGRAGDQTRCSRGRTGTPAGPMRRSTRRVGGGLYKVRPVWL